MSEVEDRPYRPHGWFPPSPHKEAILERIQQGLAHIEERGHNKPPLLIFQDGGVMELPTVRYDGKQFLSTGTPATRQTKHSDVCGTIDELKELLKDQPELAKSDPDRLFQLLEDACYMISRMKRRCGKYREFASAIGSLSQQMQAVAALAEPKSEEASRKADQIGTFLKESPDGIADQLERLNQLAEGIRDVANRVERALSSYKERAIEIGELYAEIKGGRSWKKEEQKETDA